MMRITDVIECSAQTSGRASLATAFSLLAVLGLLLQATHAAAVPQEQDLSALEAAPPGVDAKQIALRAENNMRSNSTYIQAKMTVVSPRLSRPRVVAFRSWADDGEKRSLIRIDKPAKDKGTGFLKLHPNLWMYVPRVERTVRVPPSMMLQSWMGSDFTNDDLVRESSEIEDYDHRVLGIDRNGGEPSAGEARRPAYVLEYIPHEEVAVVWAKIVAWVDVESGAPVRQDFYDEEGTRIRTMTFGEYRKVGERYVPHLWNMTPLDKQGHSTTLEVESIQYDEEFDSDIFTTRQLKKSR